MVDEGRTSGFDMTLHYALGKLKLCNVERKEQERVFLERIYNGNDVFVWLPQNTVNRKQLILIMVGEMW